MEKMIEYYLNCPITKSIIDNMVAMEFQDGVSGDFELVEFIKQNERDILYDIVGFYKQRYNQMIEDAKLSPIPRFFE